MNIATKLRFVSFKTIGIAILVMAIGFFSVPPSLVAAAEQPQPPRGMELFNEANRIRAENRLPLLEVNQALSTSAQRKCADMVDYGYYGHKNPYTNQRGLDIIREGMPKGSIAEILNFGPPNTAEHFFQSWMNSPGHRKIILDPKYTQVGFSICYASHAENRIMLVGHFGTIPGPRP